MERKRQLDFYKWRSEAPFWYFVKQEVEGKRDWLFIEERGRDL